MRSRLQLLALFTCLYAMPAIAQPPSAASAYTFTARSVTYANLSGGNAVTFSPNADDGLALYNGNTAIPIGFPFNFCGTNYTAVAIGANGFITFNTSITSGAYTGPSALSSCAPCVMPFWDNADGRTGGSAYFSTTGIAPNRVFTFEWRNWGTYNVANNTHSMQVKLYEGGFIEFIYKRETNYTANVSHGIGIARTNLDYKFLTGTSASPATTTSSTSSPSGVPATGQSYLFNFCYTPVVTNNAASLTKCVGDKAVYIVAANYASAYQWQENSGSGFQNLSDNGTYSGTQTANLTVNGLTNNFDGRAYRCVLAGTCPATVNSTAASLKLSNALKIYSISASDTICQGNPFQVNVTASGAGLTYQWQEADTTGAFKDMSDVPPYSGTHTSSLHISSVMPTMNKHNYRVNAISSLKSCPTNNVLPSSNVGLDVTPAPGIFPKDPSVNTGSSITIHALTTADSARTLTFQWMIDLHNGQGFRKISDNSSYVGALTDSLVINNIDMSMFQATYVCLVYGTCGTDHMYSDATTLNVINTTSVSNMPSVAFGMYPNPAVNNITITSKAGVDISSIQILNMMGQSVLMQNSGFNSNRNTIDISSLPRGMYHIRLIGNSGSINEFNSFVKQ